MSTVLFRPVAARTRANLDKGMREFPHDCHTSRFLSRGKPEYARQIARDGTVGDENRDSLVCNAFELNRSYLSNFRATTVGSQTMLEYWIQQKPESFNDAIRASSLENGFFGAAFTGHVPNVRIERERCSRSASGGTKWEYSTFDVACEYQLIGRLYFSMVLLVMP